MKSKPFKVNTFFSLVFLNLILRFISVKCGGVSIGWRSWIKASTSIGKGSGCGWGLVVRGSGKLTIGNYCAIGENVRIITSNHDSSRLSLNYKLQDDLLQKRFINSKMDVQIGHDVWIGDQVMVLPNVKIGNGAVIAAGAVVTKDVPHYSVVAGVPARVIKYRFSPDLISKLDQLSWWNWSEEELHDNHHLFALDLSLDSEIKQLESLIASRVK